MNKINQIAKILFIPLAVLITIFAVIDLQTPRGEKGEIAKQEQQIEIKEEVRKKIQEEKRQDILIFHLNIRRAKYLDEYVKSITNEGYEIISIVPATSGGILESQNSYNIITRKRKEGL